MTPERETPDVLTGLPGRIGDTIGTWAERTPERPAILEHDGSWTYGELARAVATARRWLSERDVRPGDRVMVVSENCRTVVAVFLAISELDAWPVLVNARLSEREIDEIRAHCTPRRVIYAVGASVYARAHAERHGASRETVAELGPVGIGPGDDTALPEKVETDGSKQVGALIYTSGSTGRPKGVMLTHRNLLFIAALAGRVRSVTPADRLYAVMPISHSVGLSSVLLCTLLSGASVYLAPRFNPADVIATLRQDGVTILLGTPVLFALLTEYANSKGIAAVSSPTLRIISASGSPLDAVVKAAAERLFALPLHHGYGITECSPTIAQTRPGQPRVDLSVGPLLPGVEAKLVQPDGATAPDGEAGELFVRGPNLMKGYYRAPKETADAIDRDGWFRTGDLARIDDGNLFLIGRAKELIIRFGFNIYPPEIEAVLNAHPDVTQSAVIGRDVGGNEEVIAFVQRNPGATTTAAELSAYAAERFASYKHPSHIYLIDTLPTTSSGKIAKQVLAAMLSDDAGRRG